jgi:uncharacterized protein (DUF1800 family)
MKRFLLLVLPIAVAILATSRPAATAGSDDKAGDKAIVHVLNRIAFGPRPGDVARVRAIGVDRYIDQQLHPDRLQDAEMAARLSGLASIGMSSRDIAREYELPQLEARRERKQNAQADQTGAPPKPDPLQQKANGVIVELAEQKVLRAIYSERQLEEVLTDFWFNHFNVDARKGPARFMLTEYERETIRPHVLGKFRDLLEATAKSPAMLFYLDNWMSAAEAQPGTEIGRSVGQPPSPMPPRVARGPFGGRVAPGTEVGRRFGRPPSPTPGAPQGKNARRGLNENYARELMELHTLGVDGGYTQKDVTEVARALTGWTIQNPRQGGGFAFNPRLHDSGQKVVLGHVIKAGGGQSDGEQVLDILAKEPATARFIATKLARRFVSDTPPPALVDRAAARFRATGGDLRDVTRTILTSPEFLAPDAYRAKVKTPFEFVVSAARAVGADVQEALPLVRQLQQLGMPLYQCQPPTGYKDTADAWVNTGALVNRMNFALTLAGNKLRGVSIASLPTADQILAGDLSETTRATIAKAADPPQMAALTLGSPEFQRR